MYKINGYSNEYRFVKYLNGKRIGQLNPMFRFLIIKLFPNYNEKMIIKCWKNKELQKSDIFVEVNGIVKGISIKMGMKNSVHLEPISEFIHFLIENRVDREVVINYLRYHYADGSTNGKGDKRLSSEEYKVNNQDSIDMINNCFNNKELLIKAIDRFILKGRNSDYRVDAIICGEVNDFVWITRDDILNVILSKKDVYSTGVHFGPLTCQPQSRCLNYNPKYEKCRFNVQIKWYNLFDDIIENMNNNVVVR